MENYYKNPYTPLSTEDENTSPDALPTHAQRNPAYTNKGILPFTTSLVLLCAGLGAALYYQVNSACGTSYVPESSHIKGQSSFQRCFQAGTNIEKYLIEQ